MNDMQNSLAEKPQNGLSGLKHWRRDLLAGLVVSFVSLPLSSGIAIASGAPPIYGIISAIIGGLIFPFVGGSYVTISGPAAGLAPALLAIMVSLGGTGDADHVGEGYHMLLVVIFIVGLLQVLLASLKLARFAAVFPASVVEGMLAAIGVLVFVKALPLFLGYTEPVHAHGFLEYLREIPVWISGLDTPATIVGAASLAAMVAAGSGFAKRWRFFRSVPPHVFAVAVGVIGSLVFGMSEKFLITVPSNPLAGIRPPDFAGLFSNSELWWAAGVGVVTLTLIDGVESLATGQAIDRVDPFRRKSSPNRLLGAMGVSNAVSAILGGLTVIPGGVKSKTNIEAGGRTLWSNFYLALFLIAYIVAIPGVIGLIPKATLGGVLLLTGWKMAHPKIAQHLAEIGREQLALYAVTIIATLLTDLLIGVAVGTLAKFFFLWFQVGRRQEGRARWSGFADLFRDPVGEVEREAGVVSLKVTRPLVCFNSFRLMEQLDGVLKEGEDVDVVHVSLAPQVPVVDHTALDGVLLAAEAAAATHDIDIEGLDGLVPVGQSKSATHIRPFRLAR